MIHRREQTQRTESGAMLVLLALGVLLAVFALGIIGLDIAHNCNARTSLQNATDAAALAGASVLVYNNVQSTVDQGVIDSTTSTATSRAGTNYSDGHNVALTSGVTLNINNLPWVIQPPPPLANGVSTNNGQCQVRGDMSIRNMFAGLVGHPTDQVTTVSVATAYTTVSGVNQNISFPLAVSLDTMAGHDPNNNNNKPLNQSKLGDQITFYLEEPCANAAWTTFNTGKATGNNPGAVDTAATAYITKALESVLGSSYNEGFVPAQTVGEASASGATGMNGGIDLFGALSGAADISKISKMLIGKTIVLPVVAGDLPYWSQDNNGNGSQYGPGAGQTRPLLGFVALQVNSVQVDTTNNALQSISGTLTKALVKGIVGQARPNIDATVDPTQNMQAQDIAALDNLSPGIVQLGATNLMTITTPQQDLSSWYHGHTPAGANTLANSGYTQYKPINATLQGIINNDQYAQNEGINFAKPPDVNGAIAVFPSANQTANPTDIILVNPTANLDITAYFQDEVGLNMGYDIVGNGIIGAMNPLTVPSYQVLDSTGSVVQSWMPITVTSATGVKTDPYTLKMKIKALPPGEHLVMIHTFDTDLGHGGSNTPPGSPVHYGDAAFYYLDLQNPVCNLP